MENYNLKNAFMLKEFAMQFRLLKANVNVMRRLLMFILLFSATVNTSGQNLWNNSSIETITTNGKVGIGNTTPTARLDISSITGYGTTTPSGLRIANKNGGPAANILEVTNQIIQSPPQNPTTLFWVRGDGQVGVLESLRIGSKEAINNYSGYKLSVDGDIIAKRCIIQVDSWADYVFDSKYNLPSLSYVESYIQNNKHLPGVPNETEVMNNGIEVGEMNKMLLKKIEELTLYLIELKKENDKMQDIMKNNGIQ